MADLQIAQFSAFGFVVLRNVLNDTECKSVAREFAGAFRRAFTDLPSRQDPAWLPGLADATPTSAALAIDDGRLWALSKRLLGSQTLPCPPEVGLLRGITPWHYDDPLGLRGVKFLTYVAGPASGLRLLPMSHALPQRETVSEYLTATVGAGRPAITLTEAVELELLPAVPVTVTPGDIVAIDLHVWHCYQSREARLLWAPEYLSWPVEATAAERLEEKFAAVASAGEIDDGTFEWPVWREWLRTTPRGELRQLAIDLLRAANAFNNGRDER